VKVIDVISMLIRNYEPDEELVITWFDREHTAGFITGDMTEEQIKTAWANIASNAQSDLDWLIEHRTFVYDVAETLTEELESLGAKVVRDE